ncbi:hypothetical protein EW146_g5545 [Bondarzewia mesenterica]|uniref:Ubiquitin-activating enzyme E1-like n=1 Tax=Bondarzewia mesenterica TaxID=1095465 RepID=A0A4S4LR55_9AGAM|nr:hypothetical protein EW146_g5545 [Bondarzewia mesenterica]
MVFSSSKLARSRSSHARAILGPALHDRLPDIKVLLVGAGGIGCELLKNIVLAGFGHIALLDLDTIDLSNLNRQFLFRKKRCEAEQGRKFNPNVHIDPIHGNIKDPQFDLHWFKQFDIVLNALDNLDARRHVNKMCMAGGIPLVESGTAGYLGQVQPLLKTDQPQLFGEDEDATGELDDAEKNGENAQEIAALRKEARAFKAVRAALRTPSGGQDAAKQAFQKVFYSDILNLLSMEDMWRYRDKPVPLDFDAIKEDKFVLRGQVASAAKLLANADTSVQESTVNGNGSASPLNGNAKMHDVGMTSGAKGLKDQRFLSLRDNWELFVTSTERLAARLRAGEETISFDKDDNETLDFVTAAANLRSAAYGIGGKSRWEVKGAVLPDAINNLLASTNRLSCFVEMAGNIIPAIATTNAIISGLIVLQAMHLLRKTYGALRNVHIQFKPAVPLSTITLSPPNPFCGICRDTYTEVLCDPSSVTLGEIVNGILGKGTLDEDDAAEEQEVSTYEDKRLLSDPDFEENLGKTLGSLSVTRGKFLTVVIEEADSEKTITIAIGVLPPNHPADGPRLILPSPLPEPVKKAKPPMPSTPPPASLKRAAPEDDDGISQQPAAKRAKMSNAISNGVPEDKLYSPSKKRMLEDEGLVLLEKEDERMEDDVIEVDE